MESSTNESGLRLSSSVSTPIAEHAHVAQLVEHVLGKDEVTSSILVVGSTNEGLGVRGEVLGRRAGA